MNTLNTLPYVVIMSACKGENYQDDITNNAELYNILWNMKTTGIGIEFKTVVGYYKGKREASYMITFKDADLIDTFVNLGEWFKQECILVREFVPCGLPIVNLIDPDFNRTCIGHNFHKVGESGYMEALPEACTLLGFDVYEVR
jgi:hypothetical protein